MPNKYIGFNPYEKKDFKCIWSIDGGWGVFEIEADKINIKILGGSITLKSLGLKFCNSVSSLKIDKISTDFQFNQGIMTFDEADITDVMEITL